MDCGKPAPTDSTRRQALALALGCGQWLTGGAPEAAAAPPRVRLAISESMVADVNLNDARAAMTLWLQRMTVDLSIIAEFSPRVFDPSEEILRRARIGDFDAVALNILEYRQIVEFVDTSQIMSATGLIGMDRYVLLAKRESGIQRLADLKGRTLLKMKHPKMCVANAWLTTLLDEGGNGPAESFFRLVTEETKPVKVVLPVFFGQADACLTYGRSFDTMCELNPQVAKSLVAIAASPAMVVVFYVFRKDFGGPGREAFMKIFSSVSTSAAGRQLAALYQFESLVIRDASCLAPGLAILEKAGRAHGGTHPGSRKG